MSDWLTLTLADVCDVITDGAHFSPMEYPNGLPMGSVKDLTRYGIDISSSKRISKDDFDSLTRQGCSPLHGDVLIAKDGNSALDTVCVYRQSDEIVLLSSIAILRPNTRVTSDYLSYYLDAPDTRQMLKEGFRSGSAIPRVVLRDFRRAPIRIPAMGIQRSIGRVLRTLDDKIELNSRMNDTLETMARAIFQSWFVDFDPVHAKAGGEPPESICQRLGLTPELLALFPDGFVYSELGEIPDGWHHSTLAEQANRHGGFIQTGPFGSQLHAADYVDEGIPVVMPQDLVNRRISVAKVARVTEDMAQRLTRHKVQPGDVVYSRRGDVERHALVSDREAGWLCGTGCLLVRLGAGWPSQAYLSELLDLPGTREWLVRHAVGATMPNLNTSILGAVPLLIPPEPLMCAFESMAGPLRHKQIASSFESDSLAEVRDTLLPKLLSGEVSIDELGLMRE